MRSMKPVTIFFVEYWTDSPRRWWCYTERKNWKVACTDVNKLRERVKKNGCVVVTIPDYARFETKKFRIREVTITTVLHTSIPS